MFFEIGRKCSTEIYSRIPAGIKRLFYTTYDQPRNFIYLMFLKFLINEV
jgi:hypothetical protein